MFVVLKSSDKDFTEKLKHQISWWHVERKQFELVEITQFSGRDLAEIKKEFKDAFIENINDTAPEKMKTAKAILEKTDDDVPAKAVPKPTEESKYRCSDCDLGSASVGGIRRHITKMHGKGKAEVIEIATGEVVKDVSYEDAEVIEIPTGPKVTVTEFQPPKVTEVPGGTVTEIQPPKVTDITDKMNFKCEQCGLETPSLGGVRRHITKMHGKGSCNVIDLSTNLPLVEEQDDTPSQEVEAATPVEIPAVEAPSGFTRPKPVKRDF